MKEIVKIILVLGILLPSCSTSKISQTDIKQLQKHWIHSHEDDVKNLKVFRTSEYNFKPSRGREEIIINVGGELKYRPISPNDEPLFFNGSWKVDGAKLILNYDNKIKVYKIVELNNNILNLK